MRYPFTASSPLFRSSRPDSIETIGHFAIPSPSLERLFRSSRPDSIETPWGSGEEPYQHEDCSGLLGRTPLRQQILPPGRTAQRGLFRSSRPDSIETRVSIGFSATARADCSGLLGRTPLRRVHRGCGGQARVGLFRSSRPDSIETLGRRRRGCPVAALFRSSRPDSIETCRCDETPHRHAYCSGLLGRTPLRRRVDCLFGAWDQNCSGLLGRTPLRPG